MFKSYKALVDVVVYSASGETIHVVGRGTVGGIQHYLHVPTLKKDLLTVCTTHVCYDEVAHDVRGCCMSC